MSQPASPNTQHPTPNTRRLEPDTRALARISVEDFLHLLGLGRAPLGRRWLALLCRPAARRFARRVAEYDRRVGRDGLNRGSAWIVGRFASRLLVAGQHHVPTAGPVLIVANHPGLTDTMALFAVTPRPDLRIVAAVRPFLQALPNTSRYLIETPDDATQRLVVVRRATAHLRAGGTLVTFPAGGLEPDPAIRRGAVASLARWSPSLAVFARLAPETRITPAIISGVFSPEAYRHPLARLRPAGDERAAFAAGLSLALPAYQRITVRVAFGPPLLAASLAPRERGADQVIAAITATARELIVNPPTVWTEIPLPASPGR